MNAHLLEIRAARPDAAGPFAFTAVLTATTAGAADIVLAVPAEVVLDYRALQRFVLERAGALWRHACVEGRAPDHAREAWVELLAGFIRPATLAVAPPGGLH